jgi:hypothetical protein
VEGFGLSLAIMHGDGGRIWGLLPWS